MMMRILIFFLVTTTIVWWMYYWYNNNDEIKQKTDNILKDVFNTDIKEIWKKVTEKKNLVIKKGNEIKNELDVKAKELAKSEEISTPDFHNKNEKYWKAEKNKTILSFSKAKSILQKNIYDWKTIKRETFYCWCDYTSTKKVKPWNCWFKHNWKYIKRSKKIEWEHIVPAENFWKSFEEWRNPSKFDACKKKKGWYYTSRTCAWKANVEYKAMEADMYNLVPAIGSLNALRSNYQIAEIEWEKREFGKCDFEINNSKVEPSTNKKWDIARIYLYMDLTYPWRWIIWNKNSKLIAAWNNLDPISKEECKRYESIKKIQKNKNIILDKTCKKYK